MRESTIFALDIGTRTVIGAVMEESSKGLEIVASDSVEHKHQAMIDGQIHDIEQAASAVRTVKEKLEAKLGYELKNVAVAAAGRALKTVRTQVNVGIEDFDEIKHDDVLRLELQGVQRAQAELMSKELEEGEMIYNCVGYSVVNFELDGSKMRNLVGQKGRDMGVDIIATFLPRVIVDSLFAVLQRAGLEMMSLTLEPIAASTVVVPQSMRQLNIALVDVGAGTSDIAVTSDGSIIGYGMVPLAGDEITEKIVQLYLVDFYQAENIKRQLTEMDEIEFEDVLGNSYNMKSAEILSGIDNTVNELAKEICDKILYLNQKAPQAVICIGGGSLTPLLREKVGENLGLSLQRVAVRGREAIKDIVGAQNLSGPDSVTPIGIAVTAHENRGLGFAKVSVNGKQIRLFEVNKGTVGDSLLAAGIDMKTLMPRLGLALTVTVNGRLEIIKGSRGTPANILLNGKEVAIDTPIRHDDVIEYIPAENGQDATGIIKDVLPELSSLKIGLNNRAFEVKPLITMNNEVVDLEATLVDNAKISYHLPRTVGEVLEMAGMLKDQPEDMEVLVNGDIAELMYELNDGDQVEVVGFNMEEELPLVEEEFHAAEAAATSEGPDQFEEELEGPGVVQERLDFSGQLGGANNNEAMLKSMAKIPEVTTKIYVNSQEIFIPRGNLILTDVFTKVDFPLVPPGPGARLQMKVNGGLAEFTTPLSTGDRIELEWLD